MELSFLIPEILLTSGGLFFLLADGFWPGKARWCPLVAGGIILAALGSLAFGPEMSAPGGINGILFDGLSIFFRALLLVGALLVTAMSASDAGLKEEYGVYYALLFFALVGMLIVASSADFILLFVGLELMGISSFVLAGFRRDDRKAGEAAVKFFLTGAFCSGLFLYGVSLLYGLLGTTRFDVLGPALSGSASVAALPLAGGLLLVLVGIGFKLAMVPFHMWMPDTLEGASTPVSAFLSVAPKTAALAVLFRVFSTGAEKNLHGVLLFLAAVTMTWGNVGALRQTNVKRLLAYSSIAQIGFILAGFVSGGRQGAESVLVYAAVYLFMNFGAFACVMAVSGESEDHDIRCFSGLSHRSLPLALGMTVFLLSLAGLPPLAGFVGKFSVFAAAISGHFVLLAAIGGINTVISLYYYLRIVHRMFFVQPVDTTRLSLPVPLAGCLALALGMTLAVGLFPNTLFLLARNALP